MATTFPCPLNEVRTPCYVIDVGKVRANASAMRARAEGLGCQLRPHLKTHKTIEAAIIATNGSKRRVVVSTLAEAEFYANAGFDDILYAVPITSDKIAQAAALGARLDRFSVLVDSAEAHAALTAAWRDTPLFPGKKWSARRDSAEHFSRLGALLSQLWPGFSFPRIPTLQIHDRCG